VHDCASAIDVSDREAAEASARNVRKRRMGSELMGGETCGWRPEPQQSCQSHGPAAPAAREAPSITQREVPGASSGCVRYTSSCPTARRRPGVRDPRQAPHTRGAAHLQQEHGMGATPEW
jgi:hypothetical protein